MHLHQQAQQLLKEIGAGQMTNSAYDTAWLARLKDLDEPMADEALEWLRANQLEDGSWGANEPLYYHDRVICTLAAIIALTKRGLPQDRVRVQRALPRLEAFQKKLSINSQGETVAFEMIFPTLMAEAEALGLIPGGTRFSYDMARFREVKLANSPGGLISRFTTMAHSAEMAGSDGLHLLDVKKNLQENNGSIGYSPAATAFFVLQIRTDLKALAYLRSVNVNGGVPNVGPIDIVEHAWVLWNLSLIDPFDNDLLSLSYSSLEFLEANWHPEKGVGFASGYTPKDGDDTSMVYEVLARFDRLADIKTLLYYEEDDRFRCFDLETNSSISTNIHVLGALRQAGLKREHPVVQKVRYFLCQQQTTQKFWIGKWHISPYYPTSHAIIASAGYDDTLVEKAVDWILTTQNRDGSWGYYNPTAEETAYCLQALAIWKRHGQPVPDDVLQRGAIWLADHMDPPYPPLWIGKCLYCPTLVVRSAILSALMLTA